MISLMYTKEVIFNGGIAMKKVLSLLVVLCLFVTPVAYASSTDDIASYIETLPTEFIAEMVRLFNAELAKRGETLKEVTQLPTIDKEVMVPIGSYTVGIDIPVGVYTIKNDDKQPGTIIVKTASGEAVYYEALYQDDNVGNIKLEFGYIVDIKYGPLVFAPFAPLGF